MIKSKHCISLPPHTLFFLIHQWLQRVVYPVSHVQMVEFKELSGIMVIYQMELQRARGWTKVVGIHHIADTVCHEYSCVCMFCVEYALTRYRVTDALTLIFKTHMWKIFGRTTYVDINSRLGIIEQTLQILLSSIGK